MTLRLLGGGRWPDDDSAPTLGADVLMPSWVWSMRARNLAATTITHSTSSIDQLLDHARARHDPLTREAIEESLAAVGARWRHTPCPCGR